MSIEVTHIFISPGHNFTGRWSQESLKNPEISQQSIELHKDRGIVGDRYYDYQENYKGQITFFSHEVYLGLKNKFNLKIEQTFYTGHIFKVVGVILSIILRTHKFDTLLEKVDKIWQDRAYGANNISVIFKK